MQGTYFNWVIGNAILPSVDPDPTHEGINKIDRTTVPELKELAGIADQLQNTIASAEGRMNPLGMPDSSLAFDINPSVIAGIYVQPHFEQIYNRALSALNNAVAAFDDAKDVTRLMRSEQDSLNDFQNTVAKQELAYTNALIELYGTPYPEDIGPGKTYSQGYGGPDFFHYMYVDDVTLKVNGFYEPNRNQSFQIPPAGDDDEEYSFTPFQFNLNSHGFFEKPSSWNSRRRSPGKLQEAIGQVILAHNAVYGALQENAGAWFKYQQEMDVYQSLANFRERQFISDTVSLSLQTTFAAAESAYEIYKAGADVLAEATEEQLEAAVEAFPKMWIVGFSNGGDLTSTARAALLESGATLERVWSLTGALKKVGTTVLKRQVEDLKRWGEFNKQRGQWGEDKFKLETQNRLNARNAELTLFKINDALEKLQQAEDRVYALLAQGQRIQDEREVFRKRASAVIQGYRTRDAAFRIFRNEKLERYKTVFDLATQYSFLAAKAYDYDTGLLGTTEGREFINRIVQTRALGVVRNGTPQYAGSNTGDPGLSSVLAEMKADWDVLKGRLGFNNPDEYGTTLSLRTENYRIVSDTNSVAVNAWRDVLQKARVENVLEDEDVRRNCMQIANADGRPVPGIILSFSSTIEDGYNFFGRPLAAGDHAFSPSSFATKIYAVGVALEGYQGMDNPSANSSAVVYSGSKSPEDPDYAYLDPNALSATPYIYLIPAGLDSMRSPPLGDASTIRTWSVDDVTIPLPFNIGASQLATLDAWTSSDFLTEKLFSVRKHQSFRPVSSVAVFGGGLSPSPFTNSRLIGRSVWNSRWKIVIPGKTLLNDPDEGLDRFIRTVTDVKLHFVTYSYSGN